jgi:NAD(P)H dehydrogenase (quinone)
MKKIIVTSAAGHLGRLVAAQLLERLAPPEVILVTRHPEGLHEFAARGADVRYGDFDHPASLPDAFAGAQRMLLISTDALGRRIWQHRDALAAAAAAGVEHVVFTSHVNPKGNPIGAFAQELGETEEALQRGSLPWTVLRFNSFAELQLPPAATAIQNGQLVTNAGDGRMVPVSRRDCAEAAAAVLTTEGHAGQTYDITGPEALSPSDLAEIYTEVSGKAVKVVQLSDAMLIWTLFGIGTPGPAALSLAAFGRAVREGWFDVADPTVERLTGHAPASVRDVLIAHHANLLVVG